VRRIPCQPLIAVALHGRRVLFSGLHVLPWAQNVTSLSRHTLTLISHCQHQSRREDIGVMSEIHKTPEVELGALGDDRKSECFNDEADMRRMGKRQDFQVRPGVPYARRDGC